MHGKSTSRLSLKIGLGILFLFIYPACSIGEDRILCEAARLAGLHAFNEAVTEYKRYLFFHTDSLSVSLRLVISDLYREMGEYDEAKRSLEAITGSAELNDSIREEIRIKSALLDCAENRTDAAEMEFLRLSSFSRNDSIRGRAALYLTLIYYNTGRFTQAQKFADSNLPDATREKMHFLDSGAVPLKAAHRSEDLARWMSTFLPGLGQMYAGDPAGGLNAMAISALTVSMTVNSIITGYYQEAILTDLTLFWRYYNGNRWNAAAAADAYNRKHSRATQQKFPISKYGSYAIQN